ncbi:MAG: YezD family protein [Chloroflexi bacterium]|nr:YezD family protein [Chloroflexota bacterium]
MPEYVEDLPIGEIVRALRSVRYGSIQIIVQDSRVVQIDRTEKTRLVH